MAYCQKWSCSNVSLLLGIHCYSKKDENPESKRRRVCRGGGGVEKTYGKGDTPGFQLRGIPGICRDLRGFDKIELPRNNNRILQSSIYQCQSWRANCDLQFLLYESDPDFPDAADIARVTDYIVSYTCKGNESLSEEKAQIKALLMEAKEVTGDCADVKRMARKILNASIGKKIISKQEAMVQTARLKRTMCTERIEKLSISGYYRLEGGKGGAKSTFLSRYAKRPVLYCDMSLHQYFMHIKNQGEGIKTVPHYVGGYSQPSYPPSKDYARSVLLIHVPWIGNFKSKDRDFVSDFLEYIEDSECPNYVRIPYERAKHREQKTEKFKEPVAKQMVDYGSFSMVDSDLKEAIELSSTIAVPADAFDEGDEDLDFGVDYDWTSQKVEVSQYCFPLLATCHMWYYDTNIQ